MVAPARLLPAKNKMSSSGELKSKSGTSNKSHQLENVLLKTRMAGV